LNAALQRGFQIGRATVLFQEVVERLVREFLKRLQGTSIYSDFECPR